MAATFDTTEQRILKIIDDNRETIVEFARDIYDHAELGYKEFRTSKKFVDFMKSLQLPVQTDLAITGAKAYLNKEKAGSTTQKNAPGPICGINYLLCIRISSRS